MRFLIDECLSVDLVGIANQAGHHAEHVAHIGKAGWKDWNVAQYAEKGDLVLVTNNAVDFRRIYAKVELHAGLLIIVPSVKVTLQKQLFQAALRELTALGEPVNRVLALQS
jgi:predicted nuclease of predicted toxin-antitoxin system